ncbi:TRAP transporter small permease [Pseudogracilibacillus sp. SE30717A]|uniref:TRAP transporter small permease n=1 Tax=Pseudogracilibacillus sp. SE30717A TaxID=3098293 RepID=UPI00300DE370
MGALRKIDEIWEKIEAGILSITTILISFMLVGNAVSRYFFNKSWAFTEEIGKVGIIVLTFMGLGYAARKGMHIEMSGFYDLMPKKVQRILGIFINLLSALVLVFCTYLAIKYVQHLHTLGQVSTILRTPLYLTMMFIPVGFFLASIRYFVDFGKRITETVQDDS